MGYILFFENLNVWTLTHHFVENKGFSLGINIWKSWGYPRLFSLHLE